MTAIAPLITDFIRVHLPAERGCSAHTCESYAHAFRLLFLYLSDRLNKRPSQLDLEDLQPEMILDFLTHLEVNRGNGAATRNARLAAIKAFLRYTELRVPSVLDQARRVHSIPSKRQEQPLIQHLDMDEVRAILNAPDLSTRLGLRDRAMMHMCFAGGLRVSELLGLPLSRVNLQGIASIHVVGKGRRERTLPLWKETARDLRAWLAVRGQVRAPEVFVNASGVAMSRSGFEYILRKHVAAAAEACPGLRGRRVTPHQLRHSCAVVLLQATRDIRKVALWLGHANISTTEVYLRVDPTEKLEAVEAVLPPSLRRGHFKAPDALIAALREPSYAESPDR